MDPLVLVVHKVVGGAAGLALFWWILYRGVLDAKKRAGRAGIGGQFMATVLIQNRILNRSAAVFAWCPGEDLNLHECYPTGT